CISTLQCRHSFPTRRSSDLQTTTKQSLEDPGKIIQAYLEMGFDHLFIRPLTPLGYAKEHWDEIGYEPEEFVGFYRKILKMILERSEEHTSELQSRFDLVCRL